MVVHHLEDQTVRLVGHAQVAVYLRNGKVVTGVLTSLSGLARTLDLVNQSPKDAEHRERLEGRVAHIDDEADGVLGGPQSGPTALTRRHVRAGVSQRAICGTSV